MSVIFEGRKRELKKIYIPNLWFNCKQNINTTAALNNKQVRTSRGLPAQVRPTDRPDAHTSGETEFVLSNTKI